MATGQVAIRERANFGMPTSGTDNVLALRCVKPNPQVVFQRVGNSVILFHLRTDRFYELNSTGARLWELLSSGYAPARIHEQMLQEFRVEPAELAAEIGRLLASMTEEDLVSVDSRE